MAILMPRLIIVSGTRPHPALTNEVQGKIRETIAKFSTPADSVIMHGDAKGVDQLAREIAQKATRVRGHLPMPALWERLGRSAGPLRNQAMVDVAAAMHACGWDVVALCYPVKSSKGTRDMIRRLQWRLPGSKYDQPRGQWLVLVNELEV
jgi:hypothetical protein